MSKPLNLWIALAALSAALLSGPADAQQPPTAVGMDTVRIEPFRQTVPVIGRLVAKQTGVVAARVAGPVERYLVEVGDRVNEGDVLAELVTDAFEWERNRRDADVSTARARLETSRATLGLLRQELERLDGLRKSPAFSQARYDDKAQELVRARSEISEETAALKSAEADLQLANIALRNTKIIAPYDGAITLRHSEAGAYVRVGDPVVTLLDYINLEIEADVPANRIGGLQPGVELVAALQTGGAVQATVRAVIPDENPRTRTRRVRFAVAFDGQSTSLASNQTVTVQVPAGEVRDALTVHKDAILNRGGRQLVVLNDAGQAAFRPVNLGEAIGPRFVVNNGLSEGDEVVIRGNERLRPGQPIRNGATPPPAPTESTEADDKGNPS